MEKVKIGKDVKTERDLQNLVTSIIFRTEGGFTVEEILPVLYWNLRGSTYEKSEKVAECLKNMLEILERTGYIEYEGELYKGVDILKSYRI